MRKSILLGIGFFVLCIITALMAKQTVKQYNFVYSTTASTYAGSPCYKNKVAYISPIVSYQFDSYSGKEHNIHLLSGNNQASRLEKKWKNKVLANHIISEDEGDCLVSNAAIWNTSYDIVDEKREAKIIELKKQGYKVYAKHTFTIYLPKE